MAQIIIFFILLMPLRLKAQTCIAHRANIDNAVENSLEAISLAVKNGVSGLEIDIRFTKDGTPLIYHDKRLGKLISGATCPKGEKIKRLTYSQIEGHCYLENGEAIPTLEEAIHVLEGYEGYLFLELKAKPSPRFFSLLESYGLEQNPNVKILSFKKSALRELRKKWSHVKTLLLSLIIPRGLFYQNVGFNKHLRIFVPLFRKLKKKIGLWTVNSQKGILKALRKKTDFIITDQYELCSRLLQGN